LEPYFLWGREFGARKKTPTFFPEPVGEIKSVFLQNSPQAASCIDPEPHTTLKDLFVDFRLRKAGRGFMERR
jgi:hypothetical protein